MRDGHWQREINKRLDEYPWWSYLRPALERRLKSLGSSPCERLDFGRRRGFSATRLDVLLAGWLRCKQAVPELLRIFRKGRMRVHVVEALVEIGSAQVLDALARLAGSRGSGVRAWAVDGLRRLTYRTKRDASCALEVLCNVAMCRNEWTPTREVAMDALAWVGLKHRSEAVRLRVASCLTTLGSSTQARRIRSEARRVIRLAKRLGTLPS